MKRVLDLASRLIVILIFPLHFILNGIEGIFGHQKLKAILTTFFCFLMGTLTGLISTVLLPDFLIDNVILRALTFLMSALLAGLGMKKFAEGRLRRNPEIYSGKNIVRFSTFTNGFIFVFFMNLARLMIIG
jgi:hypothetical protein